jgi:predicted TIM-barrel fold metal-dependent hydrolase
MSYNGHVVIDTDCHIREYWDLDRTYKDTIAPAYREKYAEFSQAVRARQHRPGDVGLGELLWPRRSHPLGVYDHFPAPKEERGRGNGAPTGPAQVTNTGREVDPACHWDPTIRIRDMDIAGIDVSVMFPSQSDGLCMLNDVGFETELHRAYHRFMSNYCAESEGRLRWLADASMRDIPGTIDDLKYWKGHDDTFAGTFLSRACPDGTMLDNPVLHPLFAVSQDLDMPIWIHGGANRPPYTPWVDAPNGLYHGWGGQYALSALIGGGVFDLFPKLRIGIFESGGCWMPWLIEKLDDGYHPGSAQNPLLKRKPSEIVASGQVFVAFDSDEGLIEHAVEDLGEDIWLFSTDYPHGGSCWPEGVPLITERELTESAKIKILGANAERYLPSLGKFG